MGMDGLLRARADVLSGILNGIDTTVWDPARDPTLTAASTWIGDRAAATRRRCRTARPAVAIRRGRCSAMISRLSAQKGIDLVLAALPALLAGPVAQLAVLGCGRLVRWRPVCAPPPPPIPERGRALRL